MCIQNSNIRAQEKINKIIEKCKSDKNYAPFKHINEVWLADKLSMSTSTLNFQLHMAVNFSKGLYDSIMDILTKEGVVKEPSEALRLLNNAVLETQTSLFHQFELLTLTTRRIAHDGKYEDHERPVMKEIIESARHAMNLQFDKMLKEIE